MGTGMFPGIVPGIAIAGPIPLHAKSSQVPAENHVAQRARHWVSKMMLEERKFTRTHATYRQDITHKGIIIEGLNMFPEAPGAPTGGVPGRADTLPAGLCGDSTAREPGDGASGYQHPWRSGWCDRVGRKSEHSVA